MLEKGFLKNQTYQNRRHSPVVSTLINTVLFLGVLILIGSFVFLLANLGKADRLISMIMPYLVASLGLIVLSQFIKHSHSKLRKK
jgi:ABC-type glycerol-3-phosphate transport system permease component